jgi:hypothetical protein
MTGCSSSWRNRRCERRSGRRRRARPTVLFDGMSSWCRGSSTASRARRPAGVSRPRPRDRWRWLGGRHRTDHDALRRHARVRRTYSCCRSSVHAERNHDAIARCCCRRRCRDCPTAALRAHHGASIPVRAHALGAIYAATHCRSVPGEEADVRPPRCSGSATVASAPGKKADVNVVTSSTSRWSMPRAARSPRRRRSAAAGRRRLRRHHGERGGHPSPRLRHRRPPRTPRPRRPLSRDEPSRRRVPPAHERRPVLERDRLVRLFGAGAQARRLDVPVLPPEPGCVLGRGVRLGRAR